MTYNYQMKNKSSGTIKVPDKKSMIKLKFHSIVDVITNSSTVIYTYQNSTKQAKDLVAEVLKLQGITDKSHDDIFYYGVFCENDVYLRSEDRPAEYKINYYLNGV